MDGSRVVLHRLLDTTADAAADTAPVLWRGTIATTATSVDDDVTVTITGLDAGRAPHGPCGWAPRVNDAGARVYPTAGDVALVVFDDQHEPWIAEWMPA